MNTQNKHYSIGVGRRKTAVATVYLSPNGTGQISIIKRGNKKKKDLNTYFTNALLEKEKILKPLELLSKWDYPVDLEAGDYAKTDNGKNFDKEIHDWIANKVNAFNLESSNNLIIFNGICLEALILKGIDHNISTGEGTRTLISPDSYNIVSAELKKLLMDRVEQKLNRKLKEVELDDDNSLSNINFMHGGGEIPTPASAHRAHFDFLPQDQSLRKNRWIILDFNRFEEKDLLGGGVIEWMQYGSSYRNIGLAELLDVFASVNIDTNELKKLLKDNQIHIIKELEKKVKAKIKDEKLLGSHVGGDEWSTKKRIERSVEQFIGDKKKLLELMKTWEEANVNKAASNETRQKSSQTNKEVVKWETGKCDLKILVQGGGFTGQLEAIRLGVARAILAVSPEYRVALKSFDYLKVDSRQVERKHIGKRKSRRSVQFTKR